MKEQVISVFHSGTRTLRSHLNLSSWHFAYNWPDIQRFTGQAHIPIRDPFAITISWQARYGEDGVDAVEGMDKPQSELHRQLQMQLDYIKNYKKCKLWRVEDLPKTEGAGPKHWARSNRNRAKAMGLPRVRDLKLWMNADPDRIAFYEEFYSLSWL